MIILNTITIINHDYLIARDHRYTVLIKYKRWNRENMLVGKNVAFWIYIEFFTDVNI